MAKTNVDKQRVGNIGLHYVSYRLSRMGWNVVTTARNSAAIDMIIYGLTDAPPRTVQVKTVTHKNAVGCASVESIIADFWIICVLPRDHASAEEPQVFVLPKDRARELWRVCNPKPSSNGWKGGFENKHFNVDEFRAWGELANPT